MCTGDLANAGRWHRHPPAQLRAFLGAATPCHACPCPRPCLCLSHSRSNSYNSAFTSTCLSSRVSPGATARDFKASSDRRSQHCVATYDLCLPHLLALSRKPSHRYLLPGLRWFCSHRNSTGPGAETRIRKQVFRATVLTAIPFGFRQEPAFKTQQGEMIKGQGGMEGPCLAHLIFLSMSTSPHLL